MDSLLTLVVAFAALLVVLPASAWAQNTGTPQGPGQPVSTDTPEIVAAPPLFPKHRRGIYRNVKNDEVIDATPQNFLLIDANYGMLPKIMGQELPMQVKVEFPVAGLKESGAPIELGVGAAALGLRALPILARPLCCRCWC